MKKIIFLLILLSLMTSGFSQCLKAREVNWYITTFDNATAPSISFSYDSKYFAFSPEKGKVNIYDLEQGEVKEYHYMSNASMIVTLTFHPEKSIVAIGCKDGTITLYDYLQKNTLKTIEAHKRNITAAAWSGDTLYTAGKEDKLNVWKVNGDLIKSFETESSAKTIFVRGKRIIYNNEKGSKCIRIIDFTSGAEKVLDTDPAYKMAVTADGKLAYLTNSNSIQIWDLESGTQKTSFAKNIDYSTYFGIALSADGKTLVYGGQNKKLITKSMPDETTCSTKEMPYFVYACAISPDKKYVAAMVDGLENQRVYIYNQSWNGKYVRTVKDESGGIYTGEIIDKKKQDDSATYVWADGKKFVGRFKADQMTVGMIYYPDGKKEAYVPAIPEKESIDLAFYVRITENEGMGSYVKKDMIIFARVYQIPLETATPESVFDAAKNIAAAQLEGKNYIFLTHQKPERGEDYESFKKRLAEKDGLPWQGASGNYADFTK